MQRFCNSPSPITGDAERDEIHLVRSSVTCQSKAKYYKYLVLHIKGYHDTGFSLHG